VPPSQRSRRSARVKRSRKRHFPSVTKIFSSLPQASPARRPREKEAGPLKDSLPPAPVWGAKWGARFENDHRAACDGARDALSGIFPGKRFLPLPAMGQNESAKFRETRSSLRPGKGRNSRSRRPEGKRFLTLRSFVPGGDTLRGQFVFHRPACEREARQLPAPRGTIWNRFL